MNDWKCTRCGFLIVDGTGVVAAPYAEITDPPMFGIEWKAWHLTCKGDVQDYYGIRVEELRSDEDVLRWTAHLLGKVWVANSNWSAIIRSTLKAGA